MVVVTGEYAQHHVLSLIHFAYDLVSSDSNTTGGQAKCVIYTPTGIAPLIYKPTASTRGEDHGANKNPRQRSGIFWYRQLPGQPVG